MCGVRRPGPGGSDTFSPQRLLQDSGGIEENEDKITALKREALEELGVNIEIDGQIGEIFEIRSRFNLLQTSYCYYGHVVGKKCEPNFDEEEIAEQFEVVWAPNLDAAIELMAFKDSDRKRYEQSFMTTRDNAFLQHLKKNKYLI